MKRVQKNIVNSTKIGISSKINFINRTFYDAVKHFFWVAFKHFIFQYCIHYFVSELKNDKNRYFIHFIY